MPPKKTESNRSNRHVKTVFLGKKFLQPREETKVLSDSIRFVCQAEGMRNRMYDGVGSVKCEVGDKYL